MPCCHGSFPRKFQWSLLSEQAKAGFRSIANVPGVYAVRVSSIGETDIDRVEASYLQSRFIKSIQERDAASLELFRYTSLAQDWGWNEYEVACNRIKRIHRIEFISSGLACPVLYLGSSNNLRRRLDELAYGGHTANHAIWALMYGKWQLEIGWMGAPLYRDGEAAYKKVYIQWHDGKLPPLVER